MKVSRAVSLADRARTTLYEAILEEARSIVGLGPRVLVATGSADGMTVVSVAGGGAEVLREAAIDFQRLSPAARGECLLDGSPAETESLGEALVCGAGFGRALLCPVAHRGHLVGILAVEGAANLATESGEALATLCYELALLPRSTTRAGNPYYPRTTNGYRRW